MITIFSATFHTSSSNHQLETNLYHQQQQHFPRESEITLPSVREWDRADHMVLPSRHPNLSPVNLSLANARTLRRDWVA